MLVLWFAVGLIGLVGLVMVVAGVLTVRRTARHQPPPPTPPGPTDLADLLDLADRADQADFPEPITCTPPRRWTPHAHPMGPVSGWPHLVDRPEAIPTGSPHRTGLADLY